MRFFVAKKKNRNHFEALKKFVFLSRAIHPLRGKFPEKKKRKFLIPNEYGGVFEVNSQPGNATYAKKCETKRV